MPNQDIELRSEEVQEILTRVPHWLIRFGSFVILMILISLLLMSWFIKYPDVITAEITITTETPPERLIARRSGRLEKILVQNQQFIARNTPLAVIENTADYKDVFRLKSIIDTLTPGAAEFYFPSDNLQGLQLGDISTAYAVFEKDYIAYTLNKDLHPYAVEGAAQKLEVEQLGKRLALLVEQEKIAEQEIIIMKKELERFRRLHQKGVIASQEWDSKNLEFLQFEKGLRNLNSSISQTRSSLNDLNRLSKTTKINETKDEVSLFRNVQQSYNQLKKAVAEWEYNFVLRSTIPGEVTFLQIWKENQNIVSGDNIFTVIPKNESGFLGKVKAVAQNSGKLRKGQMGNIYLDNYPDREFGVLKGTIEYISLTPDKDENLLIDMSLPDGLITSYNKSIVFRQEMKGTVNIVTEDLRLIERLLYQFRDMFSRKAEVKENNKKVKEDKDAEKAKKGNE